MKELAFLACSRQWRCLKTRIAFFHAPKVILFHLVTEHVKNLMEGTSLVVQWLRFRTSNKGDAGSIPGQGTKIPYAVRYGQKEFKNKPTEKSKLLRRKKKKNLVELCEPWTTHFPFWCLKPEDTCVCIVIYTWCIHAKSLQSTQTLWDPMDCSPTGSSVHGVLQARILEWVTMPSFRGSSQPRDGTFVSYVSCIGRQVLYH